MSRVGAVLVLDNRDSFVHNLARYVRRLGHETRVVRSDGLDPAEALCWKPSHVVLSPGPCTPAEAGASVTIVQALEGVVPILGVCLGHQCIAAAHGAAVTRAPSPTHGKAVAVTHFGDGIFHGLPSPFEAGLYHSLAVPEAGLPATLRVVARAPDGTVMAIRHADPAVPTWGVQFHPESVLTQHGEDLLRNFLALCRKGRQ
jgi:anthranilate synthase/aminodeoxychorismate synthase-like glutamine amidotransferase